ncbi:MAG TPA: hypothetical protein VGJ92_10135 [Methanocella sp.]
MPDLPDRIEIGVADEESLSAYEMYVAEKLDAPEYRRIMLGLGRLTRSLLQIAATWQHASRGQSLSELGQVLAKLHEIEAEAEKVRDDYVRGHLVERLDELAALRRSLAEEIRWDEQSQDAMKAT